jgi:putative transposase
VLRRPFESGQFTSAAFLEELETRGVRISMDGKGRFLDNIFIERLWRSLKYEEVFIKAYGSVAEARRGIGAWLTFYNDERVHQALDYRTPGEAYMGAVARGYDAAPAEQLGQRCALPTSPQAQQQQGKDSNHPKVGVGIDGASLVRDGERATGGSLS